MNADTLETVCGSNGSEADDGSCEDIETRLRDMREIVDEIAEHIAEARAELPTESEAETRSLLERLGDPADIAADARQRFGVVPARPGWMETAALVLLLSAGSYSASAGSSGSCCSGRRPSGRRGRSCSERWSFRAASQGRSFCSRSGPSVQTAATARDSV